MSVVKRPANPLRAAILKTAQQLDAPTLDRSPAEARLRGFFAHLLGTVGADAVAPEAEDQAMAVAMPYIGSSVKAAQALKDLVAAGDKNKIAAGVADLLRQRKRPAPMVITQGRMPDAVRWEMPSADDMAPTTDDLAQHLTSTLPDWRLKPLPFSIEDSRAGFMENARAEGLDRAIRTVRPPYETAAREARYEFLRDNQIPSYGNDVKLPLPPMTDGPPVFVHPSVSEWEANDLMKAAQRGMDISREIAPTPHTKSPSTISMGPDGGGGAWQNFNGELTINRGGEPGDALRTGAHEMRHAWQYGDKAGANLIDAEMFSPYVQAAVDYPGYRAHPSEVDAWATGNIAELIDTSRSQGQGVLDPQYLLEMARAYERRNADLLRQQAILKTKQRFAPYNFDFTSTDQRELPFFPTLNRKKK